jgi:hypothetical protein
MANTDVKIEIYKKAEIQGTLDMYAKTKFPLALNYGIKNIKNITETTGSYSKTIKIPATKNNNKVLKNIGYDNVINYQSLLDNSIQCRVSQNTNVIIIGSLQVKSIITSERIEEYQVTILGSNITWGKVFAEEFMCDISSNFDNGQLRTWSNGLWKSINDNTNYPFNNSVFSLPVICWGEWAKESYTASPLGYIKKMDLGEVRPAFFIKNLLHDYFNKAGYTLESNFIDNTDFRKLIIPTKKSDWHKENPALIDRAEVLSTFEFVDRNVIPFPNQSASKPIARYISKLYEGKGYNYIVPFDNEIKDNLNVQDIAIHNTYFNSAGTGFSGGTYNGDGFSYFDGRTNTANPSGTLATTHKFTAPTKSTYRFKVELSIARQEYSKVRTEIHLYKSCKDLWLGEQQFTNQDFFDHPTRNDLYGGIMLNTNTPGSNPNALFLNNEPIILASQVNDSNLGNTLGFLDTQYNQSNPVTPFTWEHYNYELVDLDTGDVDLESGDIVLVYQTNEFYSPWINATRGKSYLLCQKTPKFFGGFNIINNFPTGQKIEIRPSKFEATRNGMVAYGDDIEIGFYLPCDTAKIDLVKAITGMFNLYWNTDELGKKVFCEPYNDFYKDRGDAINMTDLVDYTKPMSTTFVLDDLKKQLYFKYAKDSSDGYVDEIEKSLEQEFHSLEIDMQDGFVDEVQVLGNEITAPTYMIKDWELTYDDADSPRIPLIVGEYVEDISHSTKPPPLESHHMRILAYEGMKPFNAIGWGSWYWSVNGGVVSEYPSASTYHDTDTSYLNLDYDDRATPGLYNTYWANFINNISSSPRIKSVFMNLSAKQISQLDLSKPIYLEDYGKGNGGYWIIQRIVDYKPTENDSTKVELLQYSNAEITLVKKRRITIPNEGKIRDITEISKGNKIRTNDGYKNEGLILRGNNSSPRNNGNVLLGNHLVTKKQNQILLGQFNKEDNDALLIIGGGTSETDRHNVLTVSSDGTVHLGENGGGGGMVTKDDNGNIVDLYTEEKNDTIIKVIKG